MRHPWALELPFVMIEEAAGGQSAVDRPLDYITYSDYKQITALCTDNSLTRTNYCICRNRYVTADQ